MDDEKVVSQEAVQSQDKAPESVPSSEQTVEQINWRRFREQREIERKEKDAAVAKAKQKEEEAGALKAAMDAILSKPNQQSQHNYQSTQFNESESEDERIEKKVQAALDKNAIEYEKRREEQERSTFPTKLKQAFNDFDTVCTSENLDYLEFHYPEVASGFKYMPEGFEKWSSIYKAVKRFIPNTDTKRDEARMAKNLNKPQSMSAISTGTGDHAPVMLDDQRKEANWARMKRILKTGSA